MSDPILWLPTSLLALDLERDVRSSRIIERTKHPFEEKCERVLYLIATGYADDAGTLAKECATYGYDHMMDRNICEHTGNHYFHECSGY